MAEVRPIDANALMELARNHVGHTVDCNDIARFPKLDYAPVKNAHVVWKERIRGGFEHNVTIVDNMGISHVGTYDARQHVKTPYCSHCGGELGVSSLNYCPNCGAKMEVQEDV